MAAAALLFWFIFVAAAAAPGNSQASNVTYDGRSLIINGEHKILFAGSIHYPRSTPAIWPSLLDKAKEGGIDVIDTYVFWNLHESKKGQYDFSGGRDIIKFFKLIQAKGLYVFLRLGPYIEGEWTYGGLPYWLHDVPGIIFRSDNEPFKYYMKKWVNHVVNMMKANKLFAPQGGPVILTQIENEYQRIEGAFPGGSGSRYVKWAANMAVGLDTGVPWVMCSQQDAPDPVINGCNGYECGRLFRGPNSPNKPSMWTENWTVALQKHGEDILLVRSATDIAYNVALFIAAKKGTFVNHYMYHGGTNFGRTATAWYTTSYYDDAPLDEYGLIRQPKWGHLKEMHAAIKLCSKPLLEGKYSKSLWGQKQEAHIFKMYSGECTAFLVNKDNTSDAKVVFQSSTYDLPAQSISILKDCKTVVFNTARVSTRSDTRSMTPVLKFDSTTAWRAWNEVIPTFARISLKATKLLDHMSTTKDTTDYLWYTFSFQNDFNAQAELSVQSSAHFLYAFVNGAYVGYAYGGGREIFTLQTTVNLNKGTNHVALLSVMIGFPNSGAFLEHWTAGLRSVKIQDKDFTKYSLGYQVGLWGERLKVFTKKGLINVPWRRIQGSVHPRLTWYKTLFDAPSGDDPIALNLGSMRKGEAWVNGQSIGRYRVSIKNPERRFLLQTWYHVPRSFLKASGNLLVLLEEEYGDPLKITLDVVTVTP